MFLRRDHSSCSCAGGPGEDCADSVAVMNARSFMRLDSSSCDLTALPAFAQAAEERIVQTQAAADAKAAECEAAVAELREVRAQLQQQADTLDKSRKVG